MRGHKEIKGSEDGPTCEDWGKEARETIDCLVVMQTESGTNQTEGNGKIDCEDKGALWGDEDEQFDLELENFGVDVDQIKNTPTCPKRLFKCWIEDWEEPLLKTNTGVAKGKLLAKYGGLVFTDDKTPFTQYTISDSKMHWQPYRGGGWCVLGEPAEYDGTNDDVMQPFMINQECLIPLIEAEEQPPLLNIEKITNEKLAGDKTDV